jgi:hypothetical protein
MDRTEASNVIVDGALDRCGRVLADVDAEDLVAAARLDASDDALDTVIRESHAIDERGSLRDAKQSRLRIPGLRSWRDGADFDMTEAESEQTVDCNRVLVEPGGESHAVREVQTHDLDRTLGLRRTISEQVPGESPSGRERQRMCRFRGRCEQGAPDNPIKHQSTQYRRITSIPEKKPAAVAEVRSARQPIPNASEGRQNVAK